MKLNKERFLKTELGSSLVECVRAWDYYIQNRSNIVLEGIVDIHLASSLCQAQWEVFKTAIKQLYGIEYCFTRTEDYYGLVTEDETDWLFKIYHYGDINKLK